MNVFLAWIVVHHSCHHGSIQNKACPVICHSSVQSVCGTGSGKTYTLAGNLESSSTEEGLLSRSITHLAQGISKTSDGSQFKVGICKHHSVTSPGLWLTCAIIALKFHTV